MQNNNVSDDSAVQKTSSCCDDSIVQNDQYDQNDEQIATKISLPDILFAYCKNKDVVGVQRMMSRPDFGDIVNLKDRNGDGALFYACRTFDFEEEESIRAINLANSIKILQLLLDAGCDANSKNIYGHNIIHVLCQYPVSMHLDYILNARTMMQMICERPGANINIDLQDNRKRTPLHRACDFMHVPLIECLLRNGANVILTDENQRTAFETCWTYDKFNIQIYKLWISIVINRNKDELNVQDDYKNTLLHRACSSSRYEVAELLILAGCDTTLMNLLGETVLDYCINEYRCPPELIELIKSKSS
jgi:ankyrin repeat protein